MSGTSNSDIFDRIATVEAKFNFEVDRAKPGSIRDTEVVIRRTLDTVTILKRLEEIKDMRLRREALASGRGGGMDDRKMYEK
ncbi:hypothetical protein N0V93_008145 [Gnomoniopsis smithogilvyi]|uniref:Uncharacterized protein n=1 Tax=Gnomoniopsis smithogilvyi TaxID=1191159 RepID=A0A9W8YPH3_9PEZI|nr:hypothetical protein N0V93_008145 [Gnomoniopsis smithogilvyi]